VQLPVSRIENRKKGRRIVKLRSSLFAAVIISGSLGLALSSAAAEMGPRDSYELQTDRYPTKIEDDQSLAPGVPGVTEENNMAMSREDTIAVEEALAANGFDPGVVDGFMDNDTRAAIREFQKDNDLVITGAVDKNTAQLLGIAASESSS
jgi:peptidoglycan hydrolase-like protein with peptidoglycan-binding domain